MARSLIEERYTWPVRTVLLGGGSLRATSYQIFQPRFVIESGGSSLCRRKFKYSNKFSKREIHCACVPYLTS